MDRITELIEELKVYLTEGEHRPVKLQGFISQLEIINSNSMKLELAVKEHVPQIGCICNMCKASMALKTTNPKLQYPYANSKRNTAGQDNDASGLYSQTRPTRGERGERHH